MTDKDIEKIYNDLEKYLINNIKRNLTSDLDSFHLNEEKQLGFKWEAWQSAKLRELKRYRRQNKSIINKRLKNITSKIAEVLRNEQLQGKLEAFKNYKAALTHGYKSSIAVKDSFFKINDRKVNTLIKSVNKDFTEANRAVLRRSNDVYRQIIVEASMYNQTGVMTERQAIKKAIDDFQSRGIDCIVYSNGARHKISNYASMAIRTASTRAHLQGEGLLRQKIKEPLILMSKHNTACKLCQPFEGKVLIDDVYSGGTKEDGKYTLLSEAMKQGLYHPNCRHGHGTYYKELGKNVSDKIITEVEQQQTTDDTKQTNKFVLNNINDVEKMLNSVEINIDKASLESLDFNLVKENSQQFYNLVNKYPFINNHKRQNFILDANTQNSLAYTNGFGIHLNNDYYKNYDAVIKKEIDLMKKGYSSPFKEKYASVATITHEYGHLICNELVKQYYDENPLIYQKSIKSISDSNKTRKKVIEGFIKEIKENALQKNPNAVLKISEYGRTNVEEMFAEIFMKSQLGESDDFSDSMLDWLERKTK